MIGIVVGTNRKEAVSEQVAAYYAALLNERGQTADIIRLTELPPDFIATALYEHVGKNEQFNRVRDRLLTATRLVFIVPEYNGSFPGVLKAFLDGFPYPSGLEGKRIALVGVSTGIQGGALALSHLNDIFSYLHADVVGVRVKLIQIDQHLQEGKITHPFYNQLLAMQIDALLR